VYELETGRQISPDLDLRVLTGVEAATNVSSLAFSQDDKRLFAAIRGGTVEVPAAAVIFDTDTWDVLVALDGTEDGGATSGVYASTGELVTVGTDGRITVRDSQTLASLRSWPGGPEVANVFVPGPFVSSDGEYLLTLRHGPRLWHLPSGSLIGAFPHDPEVGVGGTAGDRHLSLVTALDGGGLVWSLDVDSWLDLACRAAGRSMTREEWEAYGPQGDHYQATCPDWPTPD
jgi:WD40 repeat protein